LTHVETTRYDGLREVKITMHVYKTLPDGMQFVEYEDSIAAAIADMWNRSGEGWGGMFGDGVWTAEKVIADHAADTNFNVYIAMIHGEAVGYGSLKRYYRDENTAYVQLLNVRPDYYGKKVGKELVLLCVNRTIELGMPRVDIHTWPGNTKAVPLYKKCGFLWEDRSDSTHLANYIPTVLDAELFRDFFSKADWYADSSREIVIKPDGVKDRKFEFAGYEWTYVGRDDHGTPLPPEKLAVGFEKTGRRIRRVETNDYLIEMTADNHELAFRFSYNCSFRVVNKSGKPLNVTVTGKSDGVISFEGTWSASVPDTAAYSAPFSVGSIQQELDTWRMHPCVLADVTVNGKYVEFGLGIEPKFPLVISLAEQRMVAKPGLTEDVFINIKNALPADATITFTLPENNLTRFEPNTFTVNLAREKDAMLTVRATTLACGYAALPIHCDIALGDGRKAVFTKPLHIVNQGLQGAFAFEIEEPRGASYGVACGPWRLRMNKNENTVTLSKRMSPVYSASFPISKLGKPYDDEFNIVPPADVRTRLADDGSVTFEADFISEKFTGAVLTEIYRIEPAGILTRRHRITNTSKMVRELSLKTNAWSCAGPRAVLHAAGDYHAITDGNSFGFANLPPNRMDENWVFDTSNGHPTGIYWPPEYTPHMKWEDCLEFIFATGMLEPGQCYETGETTFLFGIFENVRDFRNYVRGVWHDSKPHTRNHLEVVANGRNPVLTKDTLQMTVFNHRQNIWEGDITVSSPDGLFADQTQTNPEEDMITANEFTIPVASAKPGIAWVDTRLRLAAFEQDIARALLITGGAGIETEARDGILTVNNGTLRFSAAPGYADALTSLSYNGQEWLFSKYPNHEPYSWWNPFIGGIHTGLDKMSYSLVLREAITAAFTEETDSLGNTWVGLRADVAVSQFDDYKGIRYSQYYLTLPGVPVLCHFARIHNHTGRYLKLGIEGIVFLADKERLHGMVVSYAAPDRQRYRVKAGKEEHWRDVDRLARIDRAGFTESMYIFCDAPRIDGKTNYFCDIHTGSFSANAAIKTPNGQSAATPPLFCLLSDKTLTLEMLTDLDRIIF
jgi:ribosomal protein S18 acetylase RimI-like enzyme